MGRTIGLIAALVSVMTAQGLAQSSDPDLTIGELQKQLAAMRAQLAAMQNRIATLEADRGNPGTSSSAQSNPLHSQGLPLQEIRSQADQAKNAGEPTALHFKGLTVTPGGFLDSTVLLRTRNQNADLATSYSATPLDGSSNANLSEFRGTARNSALSLLIQGSAGSTKLRGYVEADFLGAAPTANYVQSSSWTPRLRQVWTRLERSSWWPIK